MLNTIYKIQSTVNQKIYIGLSNNYVIRWRQHRTELANNRHGNKHLQHHYNKNGDVFEYSIVWQGDCTPEELFEKEQYYIKKFDSNNKEHGFNMNSGGLGSLGLIHPSRTLRAEEVKHIKRLLYFKAFQVQKMARYLKLPADTILGIRDKDHYKEVTLEFDSYTQYQNSYELAKEFRCKRSVEQIDVVYNWLMENPDALQIPSSLGVNIADVLRNNARLREDYEHKHKIEYIEKRRRKQKELRSLQQNEKVKKVLTLHLEGVSPREIAKAIGTTPTYVNGLIRGDKLPKLQPELRAKVKEIKMLSL